MPSPILWVSYDPLTTKFDLALLRNLTASEFNTIQGLVPGLFNAEVLKIQLAGVCDTFTMPPDGVCNVVHSGAGSMGFRAEKYVCDTHFCGWLKGGTTFSHGSVVVGDTVYQPDTNRAYGTVQSTVCANGVDASFFYANPG